MYKQLKIQFSFVVVLAALALSVVPASAQQPALQGLDGKPFPRAEVRGKIVVLSFGATWVPLAAKELPALQKLADRYAARCASREIA